MSDVHWDEPYTEEDAVRTGRSVDDRPPRNSLDDLLHDWVEHDGHHDGAGGDGSGGGGNGNGNGAGGNGNAKTAEPHYEWTEMGNARRLLAAHRGNLHYAPGLGWCAWDRERGRWLIGKVAESRVRRWATKVVEDLLLEVAALSARAAVATAKGDAAAARYLSDRAEGLLTWANKSQRDHMVTAMLNLAKDTVIIESEAFDAKPMLFNCPNGTIDLTTGELREHRREDLLTQQSPVPYDTDAQCPTFERFVREITLADEKPDERTPLVHYLYRLFGYGLTGDTREQVWHLLFGSGENGKTTLVEALEYVMGDYAATMEPESITLHRGGHDANAPSPAKARLRGKRFTKVTETAEGARIDAAEVKKLCGEDKLSGRHLNQEIIEFRPTHKLFVYTNHRPLAGETTHAFWRRVRLIPFDLNLQDHPERKDKKLLSKLRAEAPGILALLVRWCLTWQQDGLEPPPCVLEATKQYRSDMDVIALFLEERCEVGAEYRVKASALYADYADWMEDSGEHPWTMRRFGEALTERGFGTYVSGGTGRLGLRVKEVFRLREQGQKSELDDPIHKRGTLI